MQIEELVNQNIKILVVDDLKSARRIVIKLLNGLKLTNLEEADNGAAALERVKQGGIDLLISDWEMPKMNGIDLVQRLREEEASKQLPFIMITSNSDREHVMKAAQAGVHDYLIKPFNSGTLVEKIISAFTKARAAE